MDGMLSVYRSLMMFLEFYGLGSDFGKEVYGL